MKKIGRGYNRDPFVNFELEKITITGDNEVSVAGHCARKNVVVVRIALNDGGDGRWHNDFGSSYEKPQV